MTIGSTFLLVCRMAAPAVVAIAIAGCGGGNGAAAPAVASQQVAQPASAPPSAPSPVVGAATLSWAAPLANMDGSALVNLAGFKIYYGRSADTLDSAVTLNNASISTYVLENLSAGTWYFGVAAVNSLGIESPLSNIASKTIG